MVWFFKTNIGDLRPPKNRDSGPEGVTLTSKRGRVGGLTGGRVFFWVSVQERRVGCEGTHSKSLLSCELPAQRPMNHVVNSAAKHLHTHAHTHKEFVWIE